MTRHPVYDWFENEIYSWRIVSSVVRGLVLQVSVLFLFRCLITFSPLSPIVWVTSNLGLFLTPTSWIYDAFIVAAFAGLTLMQAKKLRMTTWIPESRLSVLSQLLQPSIVASLLAYLGCGGLLVRCYLGLLGGPYNSLTTPCGQDLSGPLCLNEGHLFLVISGSYLGLSLWIDFHFYNGNVINFPLLDQSGNSQLKRSIVPILKTSLLQVFSDLRWLYIAYYCLVGYHIENFFYGLFGIESLRQATESSWSSTVSSHLWLFIACLTLLTLLGFCVRLGVRICVINFTKPLQFPSNDGLVEAMGSSDVLLGHLACHDFAHLAANSQERRSEFFKLSQPGGHPHGWNRLSVRCLTMLDGFLRRINESSQSLRASHQAAMAKHQEEEDLRKKFVTGPTRVVDRHSGVQDLNGEPSLLTGVHKRALSFTKIIDAATERLQRYPLLSSAPDSALRTAFAQCQPIIWTVEGLSFLITASVKEDRFGVVQKDLGEILVALLTLQQTVDRQKGLSSSSTKKNRCESRDQQLKHELRSTIKSSIYRIVLAFGDHILNVEMPAEHHKKLTNYLNFMEG